MSRVRSYPTVDAEEQALAPEGSVRGLDRVLQLQAIEAEVRNLEARKSHAEDLVLEQMERGEQLHGRLGPLRRKKQKPGNAWPIWRRVRPESWSSWSVPSASAVPSERPSSRPS